MTRRRAAERRVGACAGLAWALVLAFGTAARGDVGPGIRLKLVGTPRAAVAGEVYEARARITAGREVELGGFRVEGEGWRDFFVEDSGRTALAEGEEMLLEFGGTPDDPSRPLLLSFDVEGRPFRQRFDFSPARIDQLRNAGRVEQVSPSSLAGSSAAMTSPGLAPDDLDEDACASLAGELAFIRSELRSIRKELAALRAGGVAAAAAAPAGPLRVSIDDDPILGKPRAPVTLVAFTDYQCESCRRFAIELLPALRERWIDSGKLRYVVRDFPLASHPQAAEAARAASCAGRQDQFWAMHDLLFEAQGAFPDRPWETLATSLGLDLPAFQRCIADPAVKAEVDIDRAAGLTLGVSATPTFFVGRTVPGDSIEAETIRGLPSREALEGALAAALGPES